MFMTTRMPLVVGWQVEYATTRLTATPEIQRVVGTTEQFVTLLGGYPAAISKEREAAVLQVHELVKGERQAAIEQLAKAVAGEREAISRDVTGQQSSVRQIVADVQRVVETTAAATSTANTETSKTIAKTEEAGRRSMVLGFRLVVGGVVALLVATLGLLLLYRLASKRWVG